MDEQEKDFRAAARGSALPDVDEEGYPSEAALARIRAWPWEDVRGLMDFVHSLWNWPDWGWQETEEDGLPKFAISTGGWSGNEDVIDAMQANTMFWMLCWVSSRRGGHYEFRLRKIVDEPEASAAEPPSKASKP